MAVGSDAALSHLAAAALWHLLPYPPQPFDVTTARRNLRGPAGVRLHRPRHPPQTTRHRGVPVTTVPQTLLDLAASRPRRELERAIREAHARWLVWPQTLVRFVASAKGRPGAPALREAVGLEGPSRSAFERKFLALCRRQRLPLPLVNTPVAEETVDFFWPAQRLVVETDGYATHSTRDGFEHDRRLDATLARAGIRVQRFSWRQLTERPGEVVSTLQALGVLKLGRPPADAGTDA